MNRNAIKRLVIAALLGTIALAGIAVGYGYWIDRVTITAATTYPVGTFCFGFCQVTCDDIGAPPSIGLGPTDHTCNSPGCTNYHLNGDNDNDGSANEDPPDGVDNDFDYAIDEDGPLGDVPPAKDVGWCRARTEGEDIECAGLGCKNRAIFTVGNSYPSYAAKFSLTFKNCGESRTWIEKEYITVDPLASYTYVPYANNQHNKCGYLVDKADPTKELVDLCWKNFEGEVLGPGEEAAAVLDVHVLQEAAQNAGVNGSGIPPYQFGLDVVAWAMP